MDFDRSSFNPESPGVQEWIQYCLSRRQFLALEHV
jgi:hypothetical protein